MTTPFAHIQMNREIVVEPDTSKGKVALIANLSIEANSGKTIDAYLGGLQMYNDLFELKLSDYPQKALDLIIDCFLPAESVPRSILEAGVSVGIMRARIFQSGDWISGEQWMRLASSTGGEIDPDQLLAEGQIFSLRPAKLNYFPIYGLDGSRGYRPQIGLTDVLSVLSARMDEWSMAAWFQTENSTLGGVAPKALLGFAPDRVLAAAKKKPRRTRVGKSS